MNLPNKLTMFRIFLTAVFILFLFSQGLTSKLLALFTFLLASLTDLLDGFIAKKNNQVTDFGKLMDPIADKILVLSAFLAFVEIGVIPGWMVIAIIFREIVVTGLRLFALGKGQVLQARRSGKHKTVCQVASIFVILIFLIFKEGGPEVFKFWNAHVENLYAGFIYIMMLITVMLTLSSGMSYLIKNREVYSNAKKG